MKQTSHEHKEIGLLSICTWSIFKLVVWAVLGWFVALFISVSFLVFKGTDAGLLYLKTLWINQSHLIVNLTHQSRLLETLSDKALMFIKNVINAISINMPIPEWLSMSRTQFIKNSDIQLFAKTAYPTLMVYGQSLILTTLIASIRILTLLLFIPLYSLLGFVGLIDGLVQRDLRRFGGGRESALLYHRARFYILVSLQWGIFLYLVLPFAIPPECLLLPSACLFAFAVSIAARTFKKYL